MDAYYERPFKPHKIEINDDNHWVKVYDLTDDEREEYRAGYLEQQDDETLSQVDR